MYGFYISIMSRKEKYRFYSHHSRSVLNLFAQYFEGKLPKGVNSICIEVTPQDENFKYQNIWNRDGILIVPIQTDISEYKTFKEDNEKSQFFLDLLLLGIQRLEREENWNKELYEKAAQKVKENEYENISTYLKKASPGRAYTATGVVHHKVELSEIYLQIHNRKTGELIHNHLVKTEIPVEHMYLQALGKLKWVSKEEVHLFGKYTKASIGSWKANQIAELK